MASETGYFSPVFFIYANRFTTANMEINNMKRFIKDVCGLFALKASDIFYYEKYSIVTSSLIILVVAMASYLAMPVPADTIAGFIFVITANFLSYIIGALLLCLWLKIKKLFVSFAALYSLSALASMIYLLVIPISILSKWLNFPELLVFFFITLFPYWLLILTSAISKSTNTSKGFALLGILLISLLLIIFSMMMQILGIEMGVLLPFDALPVDGL